MLLTSLKRSYYQFYMQLMSVFTASRYLTPYIILGTVFLLHIIIMWPGHMSPDSYTQYEAAVHGIFDDHHPPMMSLLWGILDALYKGPGLLFLLHLSMLYGACLLFIMSAQNQALKIAYSLFVLMPHVLFYAAMLWKDVGFAFSFLLAVALLHFYINQKKSIDAGGVISICVLIFYGSAVKFQGKYVAPLIIFGVWYCLDNYSITFKTILKTILWSGIFIGALQLFNDFWVPPARKAHSWQCVKIYDLAAMSLYAGKPLFPAFLQAAPDFSMHSIQARFNHQRVDDLFMPPHNPLRLCKDEQERMQLLRYWQNTVREYVLLYLYHRGMNWWTMVTNMPLQQFETMDFSQFGGLGWFVSLQKAAANTQYSSSADTIKHYVGKGMITLLYCVRYCFKFVFLIPCMFFYLFFGVFYFKRYGRGMSLIVMSSISIWFLTILFFCSMASDMRYAYIAACMTYASHGIAWELWRKKRMLNTFSSCPDAKKF